MRSKFRVRGLLAAAALIAGIGMPGLMAADTAEAAKPKKKFNGSVVLAGSQRHVGVVSFNVHKGNKKLAADIRRVTSRADVDVVAWQEAQNAHGIITSLTGWTTHQPTGNAARKQPISWRTSVFDFVDAGQSFASPSGNGAPNRWITWVTLKHRLTGHVVTLMNNHLNSEIEAHKFGKPGHPNMRRADRVAKTQKHLELLRGGLRTMPGITVAAGDFNIGWKADKRAKSGMLAWNWLHPVATSNWQRFGTAGYLNTHRGTNRKIDHIYVGRKGIRSGAVRLSAHGVWDGYTSDHRPVWLQLRLIGSPKTP